MLPYEPLIKTIQSRIKCYTRKTKKKLKSGEIHSYSSKQFVITLKNSQPFACREEVTILRTEDFFKMNKLLNERRSEFEEHLEHIISLKKEIKLLKEKLRYYEDLEVDVKLLKLKRLEKEIEKLEKISKKQQDEISYLKSRLESKDLLIKKLKGSSVLGKITSIFTDKEGENP